MGFSKSALEISHYFFVLMLIKHFKNIGSAEINIITKNMSNV